jgi:tetratricopeptide (TPR) repeat protein
MLAKSLMLSASSLGEKSATFELIQSAINTGNLSKYQEQLQRLGLLAKKDHDPEAMMLLGKVLLSQGQNKEALLWLQKSTQPPTGNLQISGAGDALVNEGRILLQLGQTKEAENAFKKAALELDEPSGYFYLSQLQRSGTPDQRVYLLKAASSGILEACHNLGALELEEIEKKDQKPTSLQDYGMAKEWFDVAAADGFGLSMLNLALMHKAVGHEEESLTWLRKAQNVPEVKEQAAELKRQWSETISSLP